MVKKTRAQWQVRVHGEQRKEIEVDLLAQIVIMLGRELARKAQTAEQEGPDDPTRKKEEEA